MALMEPTPPSGRTKITNSKQQETASMIRTFPMDISQRGQEMARPRNKTIRQIHIIQLLLHVESLEVQI